MGSCNSSKVVDLKNHTLQERSMRSVRESCDSVNSNAVNSVQRKAMGFESKGDMDYLTKANMVSFQAP